MKTAATITLKYDNTDLVFKMLDDLITKIPTNEVTWKCVPETHKIHISFADERWATMIGLKYQGQLVTNA